MIFKRSLKKMGWSLYEPCVLVFGCSFLPMADLKRELTLDLWEIPYQWDRQRPVLNIYVTHQYMVLSWRYTVWQDVLKIHTSYVYFMITWIISFCFQSVFFCFALEQFRHLPDSDILKEVLVESSLKVRFSVTNSEIKREAFSSEYMFLTSF